MDTAWYIIRYLSGAEIMLQRQVCKLWKVSVDNVSMEEWRQLYCARVCDCLCVGRAFNWKHAMVNASQFCGVFAECTWHNVIVRVCAPWTIVDTIDAPLREGIVRCSEVHAHVIDYIYDDKFRLRGLGRSCLQRGVTDQCCNCRNKRQCLFMRYDYYLRPLNAVSVELDECLARHLCEV